MTKKLLINFVILLAIIGQSAALAQAQSQEKLDDSLRVDFWYGGWEADYTKTAYELMLSYRQFDSVHLFGGIGDSDQIFYDRSKIYAGGYYFYRDYSYFKLFISERDYDYPVDPNTFAPNPDSSSYDKVPKLELELSNYFNKDFIGVISYELSRPEFFHDPDTSVTVHKIGAELHLALPITGLRAKLYTTMLRDPDPEKTEIKGRNNTATPAPVATSTDVAFKTSSLFGGAIEYVQSDWEFEFKILENRDLDESYDYSLLNKFVYKLGDERNFRLDYIHDEYSNQSNLAGKDADVYMVSFDQQLSKNFKFGVGYKNIDVPKRRNDSAFVATQVKTGMLFK